MTWSRGDERAGISGWPVVIPIEERCTAFQLLASGHTPQVIVGAAGCVMPVTAIPFNQKQNVCSAEGSLVKTMRSARNILHDNLMKPDVASQTALIVCLLEVGLFVLFLVEFVLG